MLSDPHLKSEPNDAVGNLHNGHIAAVCHEVGPDIIQRCVHGAQAHLSAAVPSLACKQLMGEQWSVMCRSLHLLHADMYTGCSLPKVGEVHDILLASMLGCQQAREAGICTCNFCWTPEHW